MIDEAIRKRVKAIIAKARADLKTKPPEEVIPDATMLLVSLPIYSDEVKKALKEIKEGAQNANV